VNELSKRVKNIQNKAKSLMWGSCMIDDNSIVFAVGHNVYNKKTLYIKIEYRYVILKHKKSLTYRVIHLTEIGEEKVLDICEDYNNIIKTINRFLVKEFPPKGVAV